MLMRFSQSEMPAPWTLLQETDCAEREWRASIVGEAATMTAVVMSFTKVENTGSI